MVFTLPFDLQYWFVNVLAGSFKVFFAIMAIVIAALGAKMRMPTITVGSMFVLFLVMFSPYIKGVYLLALIVIGILLGLILTRVFKF